MCASGGKSPTQELVWSWAQQNKTVGDLLKVLDQMGHARARSLFQSQGDESVRSVFVVMLSLSVMYNKNLQHLFTTVIKTCVYTLQ